MCQVHEEYDTAHKLSYIVGDEGLAMFSDMHFDCVVEKGLSDIPSATKTTRRPF